MVHYLNKIKKKIYRYYWSPTLLAFSVLFIWVLPLFSQTYFWTAAKPTGETFDGGSGQWVQGNTGTNGSFANQWCINSGNVESGEAPGLCGGNCSPSDWCMTVSAPNLLGGCALGAAYYAGGLGGELTDKSMMLNVNCTGPGGVGNTPNQAITLHFDWIGYGEPPLNDYATLYWSTTSTSVTSMVGWNQIATFSGGPTCNSNCTFTTQGLWQHYSTVLPAGCQNSSTLRFKFRWRNNANATGTDPSFAVDDIRLSIPSAPLPITFLHFSAKKKSGSVYLSWSVAADAGCSYFIIERESATNKFIALDTVLYDVFSNKISDYDFVDYRPVNGLNKYRLRAVSTNGNYVQSNTQTVVYQDCELHYAYPPYKNEKNEFQLLAIVCGKDELVSEIFDSQGNLLCTTFHQANEEVTLPCKFVKQESNPLMILIKTTSSFGMIYSKTIIF